MNKKREQTILIIAGIVIAIVLICGVGSLFFGLLALPIVSISPAYVTVLPLNPVFGKAATPTPVTHVEVTRLITTAEPSPTPTPVQRVEVTRLVTTAEPSPTPAVCTPLPDGMTLSITPGLDTIGQTMITLELSGLESGEELRFIYSQERADGGTTIEEWDMGPVGENGRFSHTTNLPFSADDSAWEIKVIHARGVACTEITLPPEPIAPPKVNCPDPQIDEMVGTLTKNGADSVYVNPVLGIEIVSPNPLCVHEPDYLFDSYGFTLSDPKGEESSLLSMDWLYQAAPDELETIVQQTIDSYSELEISRETITIDGIEGVLLWPLPGTDATTQIYLVANNRLYHLIFWSVPLDEQAHQLLHDLRFIEPTQTLDSLNLPAP